LDCGTTNTCASNVERKLLTAEIAKEGAEFAEQSDWGVALCTSAANDVEQKLLTAEIAEEGAEFAENAVG
jgi:hypothetical protein